MTRLIDACSKPGGRGALIVLTLLLGACWLIPIARAGTFVTVETATTAMADTGTSQTPVSVGCGGGSTLLGGGFRDSVAADGDTNQTIPTNGLTMHGTYPSDGNANASANGATDPSSWTAMGGFAAVSEAGDNVTAFALCATGGPSGTEVVTNTVDGPQADASTDAVTATCPSGTSLIGGGGLTNDGTTEPSFKVIGSYPSDASGDSSANGATDPTSWTAVGAAGGVGSAANTTTAYAICDTDATPLQTIVARTDDLNNPQTPTTFVTATATCPSTTTLIGGGVDATGNAVDGDTGTPQQGVHVRGTYPSNADGTAVDNGATDVNSWTAIVQSGGQSTPGTDTHVWALCLGTSSSPPAPGETASSGSGGSGPESGGTGNDTQTSGIAGSGGSSSGSTGGSSSTASSSSGDTPSGLTPTGKTALLVGPTVEATESRKITPGAAGSMTVGSGSQGVNIGWTKHGLGSAPLKLAVSFTSISVPGSKDVSATSAAVTLKVTSGSGDKVSQLAFPLDISFPGAASNVTPAFSGNGRDWTLIPELASARLLPGLSYGYYRDSLGALHILTLRAASDFGLLVTSKGLDVASGPLAFGFLIDPKLELSRGAQLRLSVTAAAAGTLTLTLHHDARTLATWHEKLGANTRSIALPLPSAARTAGDYRLVLALASAATRVVHGTGLELLAGS